jgi:DNA-binding SARP family transcriptional activator
MTTLTRPAATGPASTPTGLRLRAAGASFALLVLLVGVPLLLAAVVGDPLPAHPPTGTQLRHALSSPLSDNAVVHVLAVVAWLAWAHLLVNVARELFAQLRGMPAARRLPLLGASHGLAHQLVATALLLVPAAANLHAMPVAALTRAAGDHVVAAANRPVATATVTADVPGARIGDVAAPGTEDVASSPTATAAAAPVPVRRPAHKVYVVQPPHGRHYDSLWDIAARHLGDGRRYHEIYELNRGRPQPDGGELTRASLIQPGWVLLLPADATGPGVRDLDAAGPAPARHRDQRHRPVHATTGADAPATHITPPDAGATEQRGPTSSEAPPTVPAAPSQQAPEPRPKPAAPADHGLPVAPLAVGLGVGSLAALAALQRARRMALRRRPLGQRLAPTPEHLRPVEAGLRVDARRADPVASAVRLAVALADQCGADGTVEAALRHDDGRIELYLPGSPPPPPPFTPAENGWELPANAGGFTFAVDEQADPLPALLQLGRRDDADVYVDLEQPGYTAVDGDHEQVEGLLVTAASRLVGAPWAGLTHVMVPTQAWSRVGALDRVETVPDLAARADELLAHATAMRDRLREEGHAGVAAARRADPEGAASLLVLVGWRVDDLPDELVQAALDPAVPLLILAAGNDPGAAQQWQLTGETLTGTPGGPVTVPPRPPAADQITALIEHARSDPPVAADDPAYEELRENAPATETTEPVPMSVNVLGPVDLQGVEFPDHGPRRTAPIRILVYLALHRRGVNAEQLSTALWPEEIADGRVVRNRVAEARALVGGAITNGPGWRLEDGVGCDWQQFQALAKGDPEDQVAALDLVRGQPFDGFTDEWVDVEMFRTDMVAGVVDLAAAVAARALAGDDPALAFRAARTGLRASPYEERLYRLAMRAADAEGSTGKLHALMNEMRRVLDVQVEPDDRVQRETLALYEELTSAAHRRERV